LRGKVEAFIAEIHPNQLANRLHKS